MSSARILPDDSSDFPSMPTLRADGASSPSESTLDDPGFASSGSRETVRGRTTPHGERLRVGDVLLGRYTVLSELGQGGMGVVYKCFDNVGGIEVALKCLPPELSRNEAEMEGIRENYAIVARLHHSAISGLRQLERDSDFDEYYLVMDLAEGDDLSTILRKRRGVPLPLDEALTILRPLASALDYAHTEKVLHRDVKPANVKVAFRGGASSPSEPKVQLLDFGLAAEVRSSMSRVSLRGHAGSCGTPAYMAPEQWEAKRQSAATDQYSLAVMAYQMLAGFLPFDALDQDMLRTAVLTRPPEKIEGVPAHVNAALRKALAKDPEERFVSCAEFVEAISNATQSAQRDSHTEAQGHGDNVSDAAKPESRIPNFASTPPISEADVLRRKLALTRSLKEISAEDRADSEFANFVGKAEDELVVVEEACKFGRFSAALESLDVTEKALDDLRTAKQARAEAERKVKEEVERKAREKAERRAREEATRKAHEEAERKAREKAERRAREEATRKAHEEAKRKAREEEQRHANDPMPGELKIVEIAPGVLMNMRWCPATTSGQWKSLSDGEDFFWMGSPDYEGGSLFHHKWRYDETQHKVTLTKGFWMGETVVTQKLWDVVMGTSLRQLCTGKPIYDEGDRLPRKIIKVKGVFGLGDDYPMCYVSIEDCEVFLRELNAHHAQDGHKWVLPTEAQWEFACRAGTTGAYGGTGRLDDMGWYASNSGKWYLFNYFRKKHPVRQKAPNAWGLYDMHGNVWEWCADQYEKYPRGAVTNPVGSSWPCSSCVARGGSWREDARYCRSACRVEFRSLGIGNDLGFRVSLVQVQ